MFHGSGTMYGWGMGPVGWIFMILVWGVIIFVLILAVRWVIQQGNPGNKKQAPQAPLEILKARYARGEISRDEYDQMKRDLE